MRSSEFNRHENEHKSLEQSLKHSLEISTVSTGEYRSDLKGKENSMRKSVWREGTISRKKEWFGVIRQSLQRMYNCSGMEKKCERMQIRRMQNFLSFPVHTPLNNTETLE
jgi:hypothetical protein